MQQAGWQLAEGSLAAYEGFGSRPNATLRLRFTGLGAVAVLVRCAGEAHQQVDGEVVVRFGGLEVTTLRAHEQCDMRLSYRPGDELEITEWGAHAELSDVRVVSHQCPSGTAADAGGAAPLCGIMQSVRMGWAACAKRHGSVADAPRWAEATVERVLNSTHARVRLAAAVTSEGSEVPDVVFDPKSPLVSYKDVYACGPRGDDANMVPKTCPEGVELVKDVPNNNYKPVTEVNGCKYFAYTIYRCRRGRPSTRARVVAASQVWPSDRQGASAWSPGAVRCGGFEPQRLRIAIILVGDDNFLKRYALHAQSQRCFARLHGYELQMLKGNEFESCTQYRDFFFRKHCTVAEFLETQPPEYVAVVMDLDVVAMPLDRGLESWVYYDTDVQVYQRSMLPEIAAGNYIVRNTPFARRFLRRWAKYNHEMPPGFSSSDNGAVHLAIMETLDVENLRRCRRRYRVLDKPVTDLSDYWAFVKCTLAALGPPRTWRARGGSITLWPRLHFFVTDGVYIDRVVSQDAGPLMHHGIKNSAELGSHYYKDLNRCWLNAFIVRSSYELGQKALTLARNHKDLFQQGKDCKQCAERCLATFTCPPLGFDEAPAPRQKCRDDCG